MDKVVKFTGTLALMLWLLILTTMGASAHSAGAPPGAAGAPDDTRPERHTAQALPGYSYTVQETDTLWDIAWAHEISVDQLMSANPGADLDLLHPGQILFVPAQPAVVEHKPPPTPVPTPKPAKLVVAAAPVSQPPPAAQPAAAPAGEPAPAPQPTAAPAPAEAPAPAAPQISGWAASVLELINAHRADAGIPALTVAPELMAAAQAHADDCARRGWGSHVGSDGARLAARLARAGFALRSASENWANALSVQATLNMWWNEPPGADPHRRNILDPQYHEIGIGIAKGSWGYYFIADFGRR